jgi:hypothetical protein
MSGTTGDARGGSAGSDGSSGPPPDPNQSDTADGDPEPTDGGRPESGVLRHVTAWTAAAVGVAVTAALGVADAFWPALTLLAGAVAASGLLLARRGGRKRYLLAGVAYYLGLAVVFEAGRGAFPAVYPGAVLPAVGGFGAISGLLIVAKVAGKRAVKGLAERFAYDEDYWAQIWEALAAFGSLLSLVWLLVTFAEKVLRYAGVSVGAVALLVANMLGYRRTVEVFGVEIEIVLTLFVGCVLVWFHLLDTLHNSWRAVAISAEKAAERTGDDEAAVGSDG